MVRKEQPFPLSRDGEALTQALEQEGCPICLVTQQTMLRALERWQYDGFTDMQNRQSLLQSQGFCPRHSWQLSELPAAFQLAQIYRDLLREALEDLEAHAPARSPTRKAGWRKTLDQLPLTRATQPCPFCVQQREVEKQLSETLLTLFATPLWSEKQSSATGLCLPHFAQTYAAATTNEQRELLYTFQHTCLQRLQSELEEMLRKHDYRFLQEPRGTEMTAWRRALELFSGNPGIR